METRRTPDFLDEFAAVALLCYLPCLLGWIPKDSTPYVILLVPIALLALVAFLFMALGCLAVLLGLLR